MEGQAEIGKSYLYNDASGGGISPLKTLKPNACSPESYCVSISHRMKAPLP